MLEKWSRRRRVCSHGNELLLSAMAALLSLLENHFQLLNKISSAIHILAFHYKHCLILDPIFFLSWIR